MITSYKGIVFKSEFYITTVLLSILKVPLFYEFILKCFAGWPKTWKTERSKWGNYLIPILFRVPLKIDGICRGVIKEISKIIFKGRGRIKKKWEEIVKLHIVATPKLLKCKWANQLRKPRELYYFYSSGTTEGICNLGKRNALYVPVVLHKACWE